MSLSEHYLYSSSLGLPLAWYSYLSFKTSHIFEGIIFLFSLIYPKLVITFPLCVLWLIISSYVLTLRLLSVSGSLHRHWNILLYVLWVSNLILIFIIFLFHIVNRKNNLRSFYSSDASISLNCFICVKKWWFQFLLTTIILQILHCL